MTAISSSVSSLCLRGSVVQRRCQAGVTLIEMLTVLAIIMVMLGISVASYFGIFRTTALRGALANLNSDLNLARQSAMSHRSHAYVFFNQSSNEATYIVCLQAGIHIGNDSTTLVTTIPMDTNDVPTTNYIVYNFTSGTSAPVASASFSMSGEWEITTENNAITWQQGDSYGWARTDRKYLPGGIMYNNTEQPDNIPEPVVFNPDGTTARAGTSDYVIKLKELGTNLYMTAEITIYGLTGLVEITDDGS